MDSLDTDASNTGQDITWWDVAKHSQILPLVTSMVIKETTKALDCSSIAGSRFILTPHKFNTTISTLQTKYIIAQSLANSLDYVLLMGTGCGQPMGVLNRNIPGYCVHCQTWRLYLYYLDEPNTTITIAYPEALGYKRREDVPNTLYGMGVVWGSPWAMDKDTVLLVDWSRYVFTYTPIYTTLIASNYLQVTTGVDGDLLPDTRVTVLHTT